MPDFGVKKNAYRPRWQETPGYKTLVDEKSDLGILPGQTENDSLDEGQGNEDAMWPVEVSQSREKERALPLPSNHDPLRDKKIGPTYYNKPRKRPDRTLSLPGDQYNHPTKYDYNYVRRRNGLTAAEDDGELTAAGPFPAKRQQHQKGQSKIKSRLDYMRDPGKKRRMRLKYQTRGKRSPKKKLKRRYYEKYPKRYERRGISPYSTPAERTKAWREDRKQSEQRKGISRARERERAKEKRDRERRRKDRERQRKVASLELLAEALDILGTLDSQVAAWPSHWNTQTKNTTPPEQLDQNFGKGQSRDTGTPRKDNQTQKGEGLRVPNLDRKHQPGLFTQHDPPAAGQVNVPTTNNPTSGSGKVLPMSYYTDFANNTQAIPDGRSDRYLRNNNGVKVAAVGKTAMTLDEVLSRCDRKIKERAKERVPSLKRVDTKNWIWHWRSGDHTVRVQAFKRGNARNLNKLNLRISCSCPYWRWWGPAHWATRNDYQKGKAPGTAQYPRVRDPAHWRPVCKHAYAVLEKSKKFFVRPEKNPLRKLGSRFSFDDPSTIEVHFCDQEMSARVARRAAERQIARRVACRYVESEELK